MKFLIVLLVIALFCIGGFVLYSFLYNPISQNGQVSEVPENNNGGVTPVTPESQMIDVEQEYFDSVNANITLEQLQSSKLIRGLRINLDGTPLATAGIFMLKVEVVGISGRTLTLAKEGDSLAIYIGESAKIKRAGGKEIKFEDIKIGNFVNIGAKLQYGRGDPLWINYLSIY